MLAKLNEVDKLVAALGLPPVPADLADADRLVAKAYEDTEAAREAHRRAAEAFQRAETSFHRRPDVQMATLADAKDLAFDAFTTANAALKAATDARSPALASYTDSARTQLQPAMSLAAAAVNEKLAEIDRLLAAMEGLRDAANHRGIDLENKAVGAAGGVRRMVKTYVATIVEQWR